MTKQEKDAILEVANKAHSPTPWRVEKNLYGTANIIETDGRQIAVCAAECQSADLDADAKQDEANAAFIVEAVNAYDKLRADYDQMNGIAANLQRSRAKIIKDNDRMRETLSKAHSLLMRRGNGKQDCCLTWDEFNDLTKAIRAALGEEAAND
jgi:hypothetical protein